MENMQEEICSTSKDFPTGSHSHDGARPHPSSHYFNKKKEDVEQSLIQ